MLVKNSVNLTFPPWPVYDREQIDAVSKVLSSGKVNYWTGEECRRFEEEFAAWCGTRHAIALANGSIALEVALHGLGIGPGDEVIVTPRSFMASASCVVNVGAKPVFVDVDRDSQNITAQTIRLHLTDATKAIILVHLAGMPCEMDAIMKLANERNVWVIEDCAQAHGATYRGRSVGSIGHIGAWSFCQDKIITTAGEGGMVTTNDDELHSRMWSYKDHGKSWKAVYEREHPPGFRWLHESFGINGRMIEIEAAVGRIQLQRLPEWSRRRRRHAETIWGVARQLPGLRVPQIPDHIEHAAYRCYVFVEPERLAVGWSRDRIIEACVARGVPCFSGSCSEIYLEKAFDGTEYRPAQRFAVARELGETSLAFLVHPTLEDWHIEYLCDVLSIVMNEACGSA